MDASNLSLADIPISGHFFAGPMTSISEREFLLEAATQALLSVFMTLYYKISPIRSSDSTAEIFPSQGIGLTASLMGFSLLESKCELNFAAEIFPTRRKYSQVSQMGFLLLGDRAISLLDHYQVLP